MMFNNYTINEMYFYLAPNDEKNQNININIDFNSNIIFNNFYKSLYYIFESEKEKKILGNLYQSFEYEFNCNNIYSTIKFNILEEIFKLFPNNNIKEKLINICESNGITDSHDIKTIFERHFQSIKNGILSLTDFSYKGLNKHIESTLIGKTTFFFLSTTIYILELTSKIPYNNSINTLKYMLIYKFILMEVAFIILVIVLIIVIFFFYFYNINEFCKQIFLLQKTFKIYRIY